MRMMAERKVQVPKVRDWRAVTWGGVGVLLLVVEEVAA